MFFNPDSGLIDYFTTANLRIEEFDKSSFFLIGLIILCSSQMNILQCFDNFITQA